MKNKIVWLILSLCSILLIIFVIELKRAAIIMLLPILIFSFGIWILVTTFLAYKNYDKKGKD